jgi:hypothetical protein
LQSNIILTLQKKKKIRDTFRQFGSDHQIPIESKAKEHFLGQNCVDANGSVFSGLIRLQSMDGKLWLALMQ